MQKHSSESGTILITGGTSGLGYQLVRLFLEKGFYVVATGRKLVDLPGSEDRFRFYKVDFSNLGQTASMIRQLCKTFEFDIVINNAGILSPPDFTATDDGFEYTYQVNFLAHFLLNEIILQQHNFNRSLKIAAVTSPVYRLALPDLSSAGNRSGYRPSMAYSDSKLYLALMCRHFSEKYQDKNMSSFSFDPGVFGSRIYRMQSGLFQALYHIAAPFMRRPASSARVLTELLTGSGVINGAVYDIRKRIRKLPETEPAVNEVLWKEASLKIESFLR